MRRATSCPTKVIAPFTRADVAASAQFPDDPRSSVGGAGAAAGGGGWWGDSLSMVAWQEGAAAGGLGGTAGGGPGGAAASVVEALVDDCILKQVRTGARGDAGIGTRRFSLVTELQVQVQSRQLQ